MSPRVSVVLPTCDRASLLPRAVASVLAQDLADWELIVIDSNRTTPPVREIFAGAAWLSDPRVVVLPAGAAHNAAAVRNVGLEHAGSAWVTYLDDDDAFLPGKLSRQWRCAEAAGASVVLCGAEFHLRGRRRRVQCDASVWRGDDLLLRARWNTPLLFHRRTSLRFDERLSSGEDAEFAHRLLAASGADHVPNVPAPLVAIHPQPGPRVNRNAEPMLQAAESILALRPDGYSAGARARFLTQTRLGVAKLRGERDTVLRLAAALLWRSGGRDWRAAANAVATVLGVLPGRWVS